MKRIINIIIVMILGLNATAQIYENFMEAGYYAYRDGNFPLAIYFYNEALKETPSDSVADIYISNRILRDANMYSGNYNEAIRYGVEAIRTLKKEGYSDTYFLKEDSLFIANIYGLKGDSIIACHYMDEVFANTPPSALTWTQVLRLAKIGGIVSSEIKNWPQAESMYDLALKIINKKFSPCDETISTLNLYGSALFYNNKREEALKIYEKQIEVCENLYGRDSREYNWAQYCLANTLAYMDRIEEGAVIYKDVIAWYRNKMLNDLQSLPSTERDKYLENMISILQNAIPFCIEAKFNKDEFTALAYECLLLTKGLLLATEKSTETILRENGTNEEISSLSSLYKLKSQLTDLLANSESNPIDVLNTYAQLKTIDVTLADACAKYGNNTSFSAFGYEQLKNSLKDGEVLLDFTDFEPKSKPRQYVCYEIRREQDYPTVHYICNGAELDSLLLLENNRLSNLYSGEAGAEMASIIGKPLSEIIKGVETVYYVPSGIFHKLVIEAIPVGDKRMGDLYNFSRLSSARELMIRSNRQLNSALLYGGLTYAQDVETIPLSLQEINEISSILNDTINTQSIIAEQGTKESFMQLSCNSPYILHLSTHGFYYVPTNKNKPISLQGYNDAMSLSGLVMSGGSLSSRLGLLTANEVAQCNLSNTSITCLASCHSGQGMVTSEGIYGLQRAFKKAGVETIIMNLWQASDVATKCFMTNFYSDLIYGSKDRHQAFQHARDEVRKQYPSPYYWAGFIMVD